MPFGYNYITYRGEEDTTVSDFVLDEEVPLIVNWTVENLVAFVDENGISNKERIFEKYVLQSEIDENSNQTDANLTLKKNTVLAIPKDKLNRETLFTVSLQANNTSNVQAFMADGLASLLNDVNYTQINEFKSKNLGTVKDMYPGLTVWMWVRSLSFPDTEELEGSFIDVSPFIESITINNSNENGGNFQMSLTPIVCVYDEEKGWILKDKSINEYNRGTTRDDYFSQSPIHFIDNKTDLKNNTFYFHTIVNSNDLVFIRFETLEIEKERRLRQNRSNFISARDIPGNIYDMIGLVDNNSINFSSSNNQVSINISGRDLIKVVIEDGSYFFPIEFARGVFYNAGGATQGDKLLLRSFVNGEIESLNAYLERSIEFSLRFIISQLSNTGLVPNNVFTGYPFDERNKKIVLSSESQRQRKTFAKRSTEFRERAQNSINESKNFDEIGGFKDTPNVFNDLVEFLRFLKDEENLNVNVSGTLTGWGPTTYQGEDLVANQYPSLFNDRLFKAPGGVQEVNKFAANSSQLTLAHIRYVDSLSSFQENVEEDLMDGVWQIIDLIVDDSVSDLRIADSSITEEQGSILNSINKVCQRPFVEFITDTYEDRFSFLVRRPPFDERKYKTLIYGDINTETGSFTGQNSLVIDVDPADIIEESFIFDDSEVYTWYQLVPQGYLWGSGQQMTYAFLPAIYFSEYVDVWGSRPLKIVTNYIPYQPYDDSNQSGRQNFFELQLFYDLKYMVDIHSYLPFTRKGTITMDGDRRIKVGMTIRHKGTNEIFYVTDVSNSYNTSLSVTDRTTTLVLERGMKEDFINGKEIDGVFISYFNIINTDFTESTIQTIRSEQSENNLGGDLTITKEKGFDTSNFKLISEWGVNQDVFNFFLKRRQFDF